MRWVNRDQISEVAGLSSSKNFISYATNSWWGGATLLREKRRYLFDVAYVKLNPSEFTKKLYENA